MITYVSLFAPGAMTEVEALRKAVVEAEEKADAEQALHEKHKARVIEAEQEVQESVKKCKTLEQSLTEKESELARAHQATCDAQGEPKAPCRRSKRRGRSQRVRLFFHVNQKSEEKIMFLILISDFSRGVYGTAPQHIGCRPILPSRRKEHCG